jgi:hypothetical protein
MQKKRVEKSGYILTETTNKCSITTDLVKSPFLILLVVQAGGLQEFPVETAIFHVGRLGIWAALRMVIQPVYRVRDARIWKPTTRYDTHRCICLADAYLAKNTIIFKGFGGNGCGARQVTLRSVIRR